ncbi:LysR family transcriptional regulator [Sphingomonas ginsenosidivorax]|uniref:LysR family transcriptional regulator n=1 Tax=Sphingomonas ginsenosidivorax TaxID=862135 RepID=A0A5C6UHG0_9SPHN|nr:LysR family transcriptional regulator [Sphingomonas ginsenosidivorax]TXC72233.1 LysR family transcriptional regulator [Sphingomonas ginsenosidivorax]
MIDLFNDVPAFVAVVECGSFSAAGRRLHLSRSAVGKAIARLEQRLAVRLFQRTTRSLSLTNDGQSFYEHCQRAIEVLHTGTTLIETGRTKVDGTLRMSMPVLFGRLCVAPILLRLAAENPELVLELDFRDHHLDLFDTGMDLAIRNGPIGAGTGLMARRIARKRTIVCAAPSYVERRGMPVELGELARHDAIVYMRDRRVQTWQFQSSDGRLTEMTPNARLRLDDLGTMLDAVVAGYGIAWLPEWLIADSLKRGTVVELLPDYASRLDEIHLIWPEAPHLPTRVRAAIDSLAAGL